MRDWDWLCVRGDLNVARLKLTFSQHEHDNVTSFDDFQKLHCRRSHVMMIINETTLDTDDDDYSSIFSCFNLRMLFISVHCIHETWIVIASFAETSVCVCMCVCVCVCALGVLRGRKEKHIHYSEASIPSSQRCVKRTPSVDDETATRRYPTKKHLDDKCLYV